MQITTVTISKNETQSTLPYPHVSYTEGYVDSDWNNLDGFRGKTRERVQYLARRRNGAMRTLLDLYPNTTHVFMIDSYYLNQRRQLNALINDYTNWELDHKSIMMGGSTWFQSYLWPYRKWVFWDTWTTPELRHLRIDENRMIHVKAVGGVLIFPIEIWKENKFDDSAFPDGCEMNGFCKKAGIPIIMNTYRKFYHPNPKRYSFVKSLRVKAGYYRRKVW